MAGLAYTRAVNAAFLLFLLFSVTKFAEYTICDDFMEKKARLYLPETFEICSFVIIPYGYEAELLDINSSRTTYRRSVSEALFYHHEQRQDKGEGDVRKLLRILEYGDR